MCRVLPRRPCALGVLSAQPPRKPHSLGRFMLVECIRAFSAALAPQNKRSNAQQASRGMKDNAGIFVIIFARLFWPKSH